MLPEAPDSLGAASRQFYDELRRMLDSVRPAQVDPHLSSVQFDGGGVQIALVHVENHDQSIRMTVGDRDAVVAALDAHEHFFAPPNGEGEDRPWTTQIVDFVAELLRGQIEVETTYRGSTPISVRHFGIDPGGSRHSLGSTGYLRAARFFFWRPRRTETARASWL